MHSTSLLGHDKWVQKSDSAFCSGLRHETTFCIKWLAKEIIRFPFLFAGAHKRMQLCTVPPEKAATSHTPDRSLIASRTCVCQRERSLAAAVCALGPEQYSSWNMCCPDLLTLVNLQDKKRDKVRSTWKGWTDMTVFLLHTGDNEKGI